MSLGSLNSISVKMGELVVSGDPGVELSCLVGSCVAVCMYEPRSGVGGMAHVVLPDRIGGDEGHPGRYATTVVPALLKALEDKGAKAKDAKVVICGGAALFKALADTHNIGLRNAEALKAGLANAKLPLAYEEVGGQESRCVTLGISEGIARIRTARGTVPRQVDLRG